MVLITGYGKRVLGSGDDVTSKESIRIQYAISLVWVGTGAVWVEKRSTDLQTPDRQYIVGMFEDRC